MTSIRWSSNSDTDILRASRSHRRAALGVPIEQSGLMLRLLFHLLICYFPFSSPRGWYVRVQSSSVIIRFIAFVVVAVIRAWNLEYRGDVYKVLLATIDEVHVLPIEQHYAKIIPVAQSSGTGKSKTVDKIATERILFPLCLRENLGDDYFGAWPEAILYCTLKLNLPQHILSPTSPFATISLGHPVRTKKENAKRTSGHSYALSSILRVNNSDCSFMPMQRCSMHA